MPRVRPVYNGKYKLDKHKFYTAYHFALQYGEWKKRYDSLADMTRGIDYSADKVQSSPSGDTLEKIALQRVELSSKIELIESVAKETDPSLWGWILKAVTNEGISYNYLRQMNDPIPCGRNMYYDRRRKFYFLLSKKITV